MDSLQTCRIYIHIADQISQLITDGEFPLGSLLPPERDLALRFGVSRSSIREGLIALEVRGIIDVRVGSGARVLERPGAVVGESPEALQLKLDPELGIELDLGVEVPPFSILQARRAIEPECAALAAMNATDAQLSQIDLAFRRNVADNDRPSATHPGDRLFHIRIAEASGNPAYAMFVTQLIGQRYGAMFRRLQRLYTPEDMPRRSEHEHAVILAAIQQRRSEGARMAMRNYLDFIATAHTARFLAHQRIDAMISDDGQPPLRLRPCDLAFGRNLTDPDLGEVARRSGRYARRVTRWHDDLSAGCSDSRGRAATNLHRSDAEPLLGLRG